MHKAKVLVIAPHMDDEVLGCGGTIIRHVKNGDKVFVSFIAGRIYNHKFDKKRNLVQKQHAAKVRQVLGYQESVFFDLDDERLDGSVQNIIISLENYLFRIKPDIVYCPFYEDNNQDHRAVFAAARVALRPAAADFLRSVYMYEIPSSTEQSPPLPKTAFLPNRYVNIEKFIKQKIKAYKCYLTERRVYPHPRSAAGLMILAQKRGLEIGFKAAEAFMILREKWG